jgi:phage terminase small subunit
MAGRKPVPTKLKLLRGNPGKRAVNRREPAPKAAIEVPTPPDFLNERAAQEWLYIARELVVLGLLTSIDHAGLAAYCDLYALHGRASAARRRRSGPISHRSR